MNILPYSINLVRRPFFWFWHLRKRNKAIVSIIFFVILFIVYRQIKSANATPEYITQPVEKSTIVQLVSETGNVSTGARTDVYSPATGVVEEVYVHNGQSVDVGDPLFKVKSTATEQEKAQALANYQQAKTSLVNAQAQLYALQSQMYTNWQAYMNTAQDSTYQNGDGSANSTNRVQTQFTIPEANWHASEAQFKNQQVAIAQAQAALTSASLAYDATQNALVKATAKGSIANASFAIGDAVTSKGSTTTTISPALIIISQTAQPLIDLALNEVDIPKVKENESAEITLDAFPGKIFKGVVKSVDTVGTNTSGVITYNTVIALTNSAQEIKPGMTANVDIAVDTAENVLTVPNGAVKPYKGKKAVQIVDPKTKLAIYIPVTIGIKSPEKTQITHGVSQGMMVITGIKSATTK